MELKESVGNFLNEIQNDIKVENTIFAVRHGFLQQTTGNWHSKDVFFSTEFHNRSFL